MMHFFCFLIWGFLFHFIAFGLSPSGLGYNGFFFYLGLLLPFYCLWFKSVGFRLWWIFFSFLIWVFFFHYIAFGLSPSGLGYDGCFLFFFYLLLLFPFYCLWFKFVGFRLWGIFFCFFDLRLLFPFYCFWFKSVGFRIWWIFFVFLFGAFSSILMSLV